jgi:two-component system invasion response regulator UvrY
MIRALIVDDQPSMRDLLKALLTREPDIQVVGEVEDAQQAVAALSAQPVDLVLLDLALTDVSGLEVLPMLRAINPGVKIVVVSLHDQAVIQAVAQDRGADAFVSKNDLTHGLMRAIRQVA